MSRPASAHWRTAGRQNWIQKGLAGALLAAAGLLVSQWLAGFFLLWSLRVPSHLASPLTVSSYAFYYGGQPAIRRRLWLCSGVGLGLVVLVTLTCVLPKRRSLHGDARFASRSEISRAGLFSDHGIILGRIGRRYLILPGQQSVILAAPPRSGKDVGCVIPNALHWPGSLVIIDIKREVWNITAGFRASQGQSCHLLDLLATDGRTARWNCLSYVSSSPDQRINDIQRIADILYAESPGTDPFWIASARSLFCGIALYLFETPSLPKTIGDIRRHGMASDDEGFGVHWKRIVEGRQNGPHPLSAECVRALYDVIDLAPVTASSVRKTFTSRLELWSNPLLDRATAGDDFDLRDLRRTATSIYVSVNPDDLHRMRPVLSLFFQQCLGLQTHSLPEHDPTLTHQVLMLLNEFTALGRIPIVSEAIAYLPGYNVRVLMVIQAPSQLREVYGPQGAETMLKSVAVRIAFSPKDYPDAKEISDELGFTTVKVRTHSKPSAWSMNRANPSRSANVNTSEHGRALLLPQEVKEIGLDAALVFYENVRPIRCSKIRYYADPRFKKRLLPPPSRPHFETRCAEGQVAGRLNFSEPWEPPPLGDGPGPQRPLSPTHEASIEDLERLDSLTLEDFDDPVRNIKFEYASERPTESEFDSHVELFLDAFR